MGRSFTHDKSKGIDKPNKIIGVFISIACHEKTASDAFNGLFDFGILFLPSWANGKNIDLYPIIGENRKICPIPVRDKVMSKNGP